MTVDVSASQWQLTITILDSDGSAIGGANDYSLAIEDVELTFPEVRSSNSINTLLAWEATATLGHDYVALSVDNRDTTASPTGASLLAMGNQVDLTIWDGSSYVREWPPLYILRTPDPLKDGGDDQSIQIELGDLFKLVASQEAPENDYSETPLGTTRTPDQVINAIASRAGLPTTTTDTITTGFNLTAPVPKNNTRDWSSFIGEIAACNGYVAWLDKNEDLRLTPIDLEKTSPDLELLIGRDEVGLNGWVPVNLDERPPGELVVIGGGGSAKQLQNPRVVPTVTPEMEATETTTINTTLGNPTTTIEYEERQSSRQIRPKVAATSVSGGLTTVSGLSDNTSTALRDSQDFNTTHRYNGITKALTNTTTRRDIARGLAGRDAYRDTEGNSALTIISDAELTTTDYSYDSVLSAGRLKERVIETKKPYCLFEWGQAKPEFYELNRFLSRTCFKQTTTWERVLDTSGDPTIEAWKITQTTERPRGVVYPEYSGANPETLIVDPNFDLTFTRTASDGSTEPPKTQYQESLYSRDPQQHRSSVKLTPLSGNAHKLKTGTIRVSAPVITSVRQCSTLAELYGLWQHGLSLGRSFVGAIPSIMLSGFSPVMRVDVTDGNVTKAYFMNGLTIAGGREETLFGCNLGEVGVVGVSPADVTSPVSLSYPATGSITLPAFTFSGTATGEPAAGGSIILPTFGFSGTASPPASATGSITLPAFNFSGTAAPQGDATGNIVLPAFSFSGTASPPATATGSISMPAFTFSGTGGVSDPDAAAFIATWTGTYSQAEIDAVDAFFINMKSDSLYAKMDFMVLLALDNSVDALRWMNTPSTSATNNGATFTARQGFTGNGSSAYIDTGFNPNTAGGNYSLDAASLGAYSRTNISEASYVIGAQNSSTSGRSYVSPRWSDGFHYTDVNGGGGSPWTTASSSDSRGLWGSSRTSNTLKTAYRNGVVQDTDASSSNALPGHNLYLLALNNGGARQGESSGQIAFAYAGGDLSDSNNANLSTHVTALLTAFGANV
ncbi:MAG: hypothetical protein AAGA46_03235 [Cyanobacteria bacterium P01_F01_bin.13]